MAKSFFNLSCGEKYDKIINLIIIKLGDIFMYGSKFKENIIKIGPAKKLSDIEPIEFIATHDYERMRLEEFGF